MNEDEKKAREENRRRNPDVAAVVDVLRAHGLTPVVRYVGKMRPMTKADLLWSARKKASDEA